MLVSPLQAMLMQRLCKLIEGNNVVCAERVAGNDEFQREGD